MKIEHARHRRTERGEISWRVNAPYFDRHYEGISCHVRMPIVTNMLRREAYRPSTHLSSSSTKSIKLVYRKYKILHLCCLLAH